MVDIRGWLAGMALLAAMAGLSVPCAYAASDLDVQHLKDRLETVSREMALLRQQMANRSGAVGGVTGGNAPAGGNALAGQMDARLSAIDEQMRAMTGQIETLDFTLGQLKQRLERTQTDVDFRLAELEKKTITGTAPATSPAGVAAVKTQSSGVLTPPAEGPAAKPDSSKPDSPKADSAKTGAVGDVKLPGGDPAQQYNYAFGYLKDQDYPRVEALMRAFVAANPTHTLAGEAQYWLGRSYFARAQYAEAATQFLQGYTKYSKSVKAPNMLLELGLSMVKLGKVAQACSSLGRVVVEYPGASTYVKQRVNDERQRLKCPT